MKQSKKEIRKELVKALRTRKEFESNINKKKVAKSVAESITEVFKEYDLKVKVGSLIKPTEISVHALSCTLVTLFKDDIEPIDLYNALVAVEVLEDNRNEFIVATVVSQLNYVHFSLKLAGYINEKDALALEENNIKWAKASTKGMNPVIKDIFKTFKTFDDVRVALNSVVANNPMLLTPEDTLKAELAEIEGENTPAVVNVEESNSADFKVVYDADSKTTAVAISDEHVDTAIVALGDKVAVIHADTPTEKIINGLIGK